MRGYFITATGTDAGKTVFTRALALNARASGLAVRALKPMETGFVDPAASDAAALARASAAPSLVQAPGFYRALPPLAPAAVSLADGTPPPAPAALAEACQAAASGADLTLVEGAGGLLVPLDDRHTVADLALALGLPLLLVAPDRLGVLSHVLTAAESAERRGLALAAVVLNRACAGSDDPSPETNQQLLRARLACPVHALPRLPLEDEALQREASRLGWLHGFCQ